MLWTSYKGGIPHILVSAIILVCHRRAAAAADDDDDEELDKDRRLSPLLRSALAYGPRPRPSVCRSFGASVACLFV